MTEEEVQDRVKEIQAYIAERLKSFIGAPITSKTRAQMEYAVNHWANEYTYPARVKVELNNLRLNGVYTPPYAAAPPPAYCGLCGKRTWDCSCLPRLDLDLEETPKSLPAPPGPAWPPRPSQTPLERAKARVKPPSLGVAKGTPCYLCAATDRPLVEIIGIKVLICERCAILHLGDP
jgi:hypothetical protein